MKAIFVSRHQPNADQYALCNKAGYELIHVGDLDVFSEDFENDLDVLINVEHNAELIIGVHPMVLLVASAYGDKVGMFNNVNRAPEGEKPSFGTDKLVIMDGLVRTDVAL